MAYVTFSVNVPAKPKKTTEWWVAGSTPLGIVKWYAPWRRYTYSPAGPQVLDSNCLREISEFCEVQTQLRK